MGAPKGNLFALGCASGRPPEYTDNEEVKKKCIEYFEWCKGESEERVEYIEGENVIKIIWIRRPEPLTMTGLELFLGFASRQSLHDMAKRKEFSYTIKMAMQLVEQGYEKNLHGAAAAGSIFAMKNMGWTDRSDIDLNGNMVTNSPINEMTFTEIFMLKYGRKPDDATE
jgi:hypothetical protein